MSIRKSKKGSSSKVTGSSEIINFYDVIPKKYLDEVDNPNEHLHNIKIPFRMCVVAPSEIGRAHV